MKFKNRQTCAGGNQVSGCFEERGRLTGKGHEGVSWVIGNILHLDRRIFILSCTFKIYTFQHAFKNV